MNKIKFWFNNARPTSLPQSLVPSILAVCMALQADGFSWWLGTCAVLGVMAAHLALNLFDDYFDYIKKQSGYRDELKHEGFRARIGKCPYLTSGQATLKQLLAACVILSIIAFSFGSVVLYFRGDLVLYIVGATILLGFFYSAPPLRLSYHGLGELVIGTIFGPLNMAGTYYAACGEMSNAVVLVSVPVGLLIMNIIYVHSIMDFVPDKKIGKKTLAVLLGNPTAMLAVQGVIVFAPFALVSYGIVTHLLSPAYWFTFLTLPLAVSLFYMMVEYVKHPERTFTPKPWMGPFNGWERITRAGIEWFMIRWLSARNLLAFFCFIIIIINIVTSILK